MRCAVKCCVFIEIYSEFETFSTSSAPSGHLLLKEKALVCANFKQLDKQEFDLHKAGCGGRPLQPAWFIMFIMFIMFVPKYRAWWL